MDWSGLDWIGFCFGLLIEQNGKGNGIGYKNSNGNGNVSECLALLAYCCCSHSNTTMWPSLLTLCQQCRQALVAVTVVVVTNREKHFKSQNITEKIQQNGVFQRVVQKKVLFFIFFFCFFFIKQQQQQQKRKTSMENNKKKKKEIK